MYKEIQFENLSTLTKHIYRFIFIFLKLYCVKHKLYFFENETLNVTILFYIFTYFDLNNNLLLIIHWYSIDNWTIYI